MLASMTTQQFEEWFAYYRIEPFGDEWRQAGIIAAEIRNKSTIQYKVTKFQDPEGFMPSCFKPRNRMSGDEVSAGLKSFATSYKAARHGRTKG
jgi:hypothetical protein